MKWIFFVILLLGLSSSTLAKKAETPCILDSAKLPKSWQPPTDLQKNMNPAPWSASEASDAKLAIKTGRDEIISYFKKKPEAVQNLWDDSIEALIQVTYASVNEKTFDEKTRKAARNNLTLLLKPYLDLNPNWVLCEEFQQLLPLSIFAQKLYPAKATLRKLVTKRTNAAYHSCGSFKAAIGDDLHKIIKDNQNANTVYIEKLFDLYIWSLWLIEAELYPDIELPLEARKFGQKVWKYFKTYQLVNASEFEKGARNEKFIDIADLANHIAHIPTGTHRFPLYVADWPALYRFHRENFYQVMQSDNLDLFASFMDTLRQYGCSESNDLQVRDGARYMLKVFHSNNDRWMNYRQGSAKNAKLDDYNLIHHPWTAILGLHMRQPEHPKPGTYGDLVRRWLPPPYQND